MAQQAHLLVVDDERDIRDGLAAYLTKAGYRVSRAADAAEARQILSVHGIDLILLDIMMPGEDGLSLAAFVRSSTRIPIILLTAKSEEIDRVIGLEIGADDYVTKPFSPRELQARIKTILRRVTEGGLVTRTEGAGWAFGPWVLRVAERDLVDQQGVVTPLSTSEYNLLHTLVTHPGRVLTRDQLLDLSQGRELAAFERSVDNQVSRLRRKIEPDAANPTLIKTVWGGGYMFTPEVRTI